MLENSLLADNGARPVIAWTRNRRTSHEIGTEWAGHVDASKAATPACSSKAGASKSGGGGSVGGAVTPLGRPGSASREPHASIAAAASSLSFAFAARLLGAHRAASAFRQTGVAAAGPAELLADSHVGSRVSALSTTVSPIN